MKCITIYEQSSNRIWIQLFDSDGEPVTDATVNLTMVDQNQEPVSGVAWPQELTNQGNGVYDITLPGTLGAIRNQSYWSQFDGTSPAKGDVYVETLTKCTVVRK